MNLLMTIKLQIVFCFILFFVGVQLIPPHHNHHHLISSTYLSFAQEKYPVLLGMEKTYSLSFHVAVLVFVDRPSPDTSGWDKFNQPLVALTRATQSLQLCILFLVSGSHLEKQVKRVG